MVYSDVILLDYLKRKQGKRSEIKIRHSKIVEDTGISLATVKRSLKRLEGSAVLSKKHETGFECTYRVMR